MKKVSRRALSLVLSFLMTLSFGLYDYPLMSYSAEEKNHIWTKVNLSEISANDSIAITMTKGGNTYVLPNAKSTNAGPKAVLATVENGSLIIPEGTDSDYAWKITKNTVTKTVKHVEETGAEASQEAASTAVATEEDTQKKEESKVESSTAEVSKDDEADKESSKDKVDKDVPGKSSSTEDASQESSKKESSEQTNAKRNSGAEAASTASTSAEPKDEPETETTVTEEYYTISANGNNLYTIAANNGMRVSEMPDDEAGAKWNVENNYLSTKDPKGDVRSLGVYDGKDFRAYKNGDNGAVHNNISGQSLVFYKLTNKLAGGDISAPKASVESNKSVDYGTEIKLSCDAEDIDIYYNTNDTDNYSKYNKPIKITKDMTVHAYASKDGKESEKVSFKYTLKSGTKITDTDGIRDGLEFVLVNQGSAALSYQTSGKNNEKLSSTAVEVGGDNLLFCKAKDSKLAKLKLEENKDSVDQFYITTEFAGSDSGNTEKYYLVSGATGNKLNFVKDTENRDKLGLWTFETKENGDFLVKSVNAAYNNNAQYIEIYSNDYTTYSYSDKNKTKFLFSVYTTPEAGEEEEKSENYESDPDTELIVAQWAGNADYSTAKNKEKYICGDLYSTNDMLDENAKYQVVVGGNVVVPYTSTGSSAGSTSYYMGSKGVVKDTDYIQMEFPTSGYADMGISFRMRSSNTAVGAYKLQYSSNGEDFKNIDKGTYSYSFTVYKDNKPEEKKGEGKIEDGIAKTSMAAGEYVSFTFDIPEGADNKEKVYVRLVPATSTSAKGDKDASSEGVNRIDSVKVTGHPVVSDKICGHVIADPSSGEITAGSKIALSTKTEGADIYYSVNGEKEEKYDADKQITLDVLPAIIRAHATKEGLDKSVTCVYQYTQAQVAPVTADPKGGAIAPTRKITLKTKTEGAKILYRYKAEAEQTENPDDWTEYTEPFEIKELPAELQVKATKEGYLDSVVSTLKFTKRLNERENIYFGQIHAHTNISDGAGSLEDAFKHASEVDNLDFIIITDHSNSIDNAADSKITENVDKSESDEWTYAHKLAEEYNNKTEGFTFAYGYEMTWSNGLGHMNTFNTKGFQSRTQKEYSTYATALNNYYAALRTAPDSISQFNHPGTTFGDFQDFAYYSEENDALITMIEVGNGEGEIGSSGYFPSYEYYTRALDKGWHVAPTNNQDNHKGKWGDANTARTVILADTNDEAAIYDAMRNYRVYATEDNDLSIFYTLNGNVMGSILDKEAVGDTVNIKADIKDPTDKAIGKVEVIVNGGQSIASKNVDEGEATVEFNVPANYSYYYLKISEEDKDIAVTAPVWVGEVEACGINNTYTNTVLPVAGEALDINVDLYNNEKQPLTINEIEVELSDVDGKKTPVAKVSGEEANLKEVASNGTATFKTDFVYDQAGQVTYEVTVHATLNGVEKTYKDKMSVNYTLSKMISEVIIDGTHYNDYVSGYYGGNVNEFINLCAKNNIRAKVVTDKITKDMLNNCKLLVVSAPAKKNDTAGAGAYTVSHFSDEFIDMVKDYVADGGSVIVCGLADYSDTDKCQTATEQNKLLAAIGSTIRMGSDEVWDDTHNGGQQYRLRPTNFNKNSDLLAGIKDGQEYSQYSGCSVDISGAKATNLVEEAEWLVKGFDTTLSMDCKGPNGEKYSANKPNDNKGNVTFIARQKTKKGGQIIVAGGVFLSDFEVKAEIDNNDSLPYANYTIVNNILAGSTVELEKTTIAEARKGKMNEVFAIEGYVTSGTDNENTTFFDTIYIQDETGGMDIFPYATPGLKIGTKMRIVGYLAQYQGDLELKVISAKVLKDEPKVWEPKVVDTKTAMDYAKLGGQLLKTTGDVTRVDYNADGTVAEFWLKDSTGKEAAIFIDGYIKSGTTGKNTVGDFVKKGAKVTAAGVLYMHPEGNSEVSVPVFRVRNCDDISLATEAGRGNNGTTPGQSANVPGTSATKPEDNKAKDSKTTDSKSSDSKKNSGSKDSGSKDSGSSKNNKGSSDNKGTGNATGKTDKPAVDKDKAANATTPATPQDNNKKADNSSKKNKKDNKSNKNNDDQSQDKKTDETPVEESQVLSEEDNSEDEATAEQSTVQEGTETKDTPVKKNKPLSPIVPVAAGFGIIAIAAVITVIKISAGASAASGGAMTGLISKIKNLFRK